MNLYDDKFAKPATAIRNELMDRGILTRADLDDKLDWIYYELWHHEGRRARHGAACVNADVKTDGSHWLSLGDEKFPLQGLVGHEADFRPIADRVNKTGVKLEGLKLSPIGSVGPKVVELVVKQPYIP